VTAGPLAGFHVLVTRPVAQASELVDAIEAAGGTAYCFPVIRITGREASVVAREFDALPPPDIAIFVSRNAVDYGLSAVRSSSASIAAVGPSTAAAIEAQGVHVDIVSKDGFDSEHLLEHSAFDGVQGKAVTIVRSERGREFLGDSLRERGANISFLSVYRREMRVADQEEIAALTTTWRNGGVDCVTAMSSETFDNLVQQLPAPTLDLLRRTPLVAPGARVIQTALDQLPGLPAIAAAGPQVTDIVNALIETRHSGTN